jgi:uncharacterized cupredoxin-like copper-binding protein
MFSSSNAIKNWNGLSFLLILFKQTKEEITIQPYPLFISITLFLLVLVCIIMGKILKDRLHSMSYMMISMYTGMSIGLTLGVMFGALYQGDLFYSTLLSMGMGAAAGMLIGIIHSPISCIEGLMAGLMGGMMGAMLGEMISTNESILILKILSVLSLCSIFLFFVFQRTTPQQYLITKKWLFKPMTVFVVILAFLIIGELLFKPASLPHTELPKDQTGQQSQHNHNSSNSSNHSEEAQIIKIIASDMRYQPSIITVSKDKTSTIVLQNDDQIEHDIEVKGITANVPGSPDGHDHHSSQSNGSLHLHAQANSSSKLEFFPTEKGVYEFFCTVPGHKESGMSGTLIVD